MRPAVLRQEVTVLSATVLSATRSRWRPRTCMTRKAVQQSKQVPRPSTGRTRFRFSQVLTIIKIACDHRRHPTEFFCDTASDEVVEYERQKFAGTAAGCQIEYLRAKAPSVKCISQEHRVKNRLDQQTLHLQSSDRAAALQS